MEADEVRTFVNNKEEMCSSEIMKILIGRRGSRMLEACVLSQHMRILHCNAPFQVTGGAVTPASSNTLLVGLAKIKAKKHAIHLSTIKAVPLWPS